MNCVKHKDYYKHFFLITFGAVLGAAVLLSCTVGTKKSLIPLTVETNATSFELLALNRNAITGASSVKNPFVFFCSPENTAITDIENMSLQLDFEISEINGTKNAGETTLSNVTFGFLSDADIETNQSGVKKIKKDFAPRDFATPCTAGRTSIALPFKIAKTPVITGFYIHSDLPVKITGAKIIDAVLGFDMRPDADGFFHARYYFSDFSETQTLLGASRIDVVIALGEAQIPIDLSINVSDARGRKRTKEFTINPSPIQSVFTIPSSALGGIPTAVHYEREGVSDEFGDTIIDYKVLSAVILKKAPDDIGKPILCDPGFIPTWRAADFRHREYEVFAWEMFPDILFIDTLDHEVQDAFFKRLAFFSEKKGYRGKLLTDRAMEAFHGFNAHDYNALTLAAFFDKAQQDDFPLNAHEILLCDILLRHGIIVEKQTGGYTEGSGGIISVSQEESLYTRKLFVAHEGFHGVYFTQEALRTKVDEVFETCDQKSRDFLIRYFDVTPALGYDTSFDYLLKNEFMAYIIQQPVSQVPYYMSVSVPNHDLIQIYGGSLLEYVVATGGRGFIPTARELSDFLQEHYGLAAGRTWLVEVK